MKLLRSVGLSAVLAVVLAAPVLAQSSTSTDSARESRRAEAERAYPQNLSDVERAQIVSRCQAAQAKIQVLEDHLLPRVEQITDQYDIIDLELSAVSKRLRAHELDTSTSDVLLVAYRRQYNSLKSAISSYRTALSDVVTVNCVENPASFKSLLENARVARKDVSDAIATLNKILSNDMVSSFNSIKGRLSSPSGGSGQ